MDCGMAVMGWLTWDGLHGTAVMVQPARMSSSSTHIPANECFHEALQHSNGAPPPPAPQQYVDHMMRHLKEIEAEPLPPVKEAITAEHKYVSPWYFAGDANTQHALEVLFRTIDYQDAGRIKWEQFIAFCIDASMKVHTGHSIAHPCTHIRITAHTPFSIGPSLTQHN